MRFRDVSSDVRLSDLCHPCACQPRARRAPPMADERRAGPPCGDIREASACEMPTLLEVTQQHRREIGVAFRRHHRGSVAECPDRNPRDPLLEPEAERRGESAVEDRDRARRAAEQDRLGERTIDRRLKAFDRPGRMIRSGRHAMSAPPPKLKQDRKKIDAAKAIDRPKKIWISRRKTPAVSPKSSVSPVAMMMITATILANGSGTDSRTCLSARSHGE